MALKDSAFPGLPSKSLTVVGKRGKRWLSGDSCSSAFSLLMYIILSILASPAIYSTTVLVSVRP